MSRLLIENTNVVALDGLLEEHCVLCEDGRIVKVAPRDQAGDLAADKVIDGSDKLLAPGLIEMHIHGLHQHLIDDGPEHLAAVCRLLPRYGVTGFLAGVCPRPKGEDAAFLAALARVRSEGAALLGFHLEGPYLTITGALPPEALGDADPDRVRALRAAAEPYRAVFSVSPDFDRLLELLPIMTAGGTPAFMTHTQASVAQVQAAIEAGVRHATHFYDVFPIPPQTEPGVRPCGAVEAVLAAPEVSVDFILDGVHVDPIAVKMALQCKAPDRVCLITDAMVGAGLPPGRHPFAGGQEVIFAAEGGPARLTGKSSYPGALAGSGLTLDRAARNAVELLDADVPLAVRMASANPAQVLGLSHAKGQVREGYDADLVLLDEELKVVQTWVGGECRFGPEG